MRRSSKFVLYSAFGIALLVAQASPYAIQSEGRGSKVEQLRSERAGILIIKLDTARKDEMHVVNALRWLLTLVSSSDIHQFRARSPGVKTGEG